LSPCDVTNAPLQLKFLDLLDYHHAFPKSSSF
jgi:hypothetical protein